MIRITLFLLAALSAPTLGQTLPQNISPEIIRQAQNLTPSEKQALARQYGITLPVDGTALASTSASQLATPGEPLTSAALDGQSIDLDSITDDGATPVTPDEGGVPLKLPRYGESLFNQTVSKFAPTDDTFVSDTYLIGVGDEISVQLYGEENEEYLLQVGRDGKIKFPRLGPISLAGVQLGDARRLLRARMASDLVGVSAVVSMGRLRAINVFMAGEVVVPGAYSMSSVATVTQALFQAGGVTGIGSLRNIRVMRGGQSVGELDLYDLLMRGDSSGDIQLRSGDVVFVPPYEMLVEISGEVKRPAAFEIRDGETFRDILAMAGSLTADAYPPGAVLQRTVDSVSAARTLNLTVDSTLALPLRDGDRLSVPVKSDSTALSVSLSGAITRPGIYGWEPGLRVSEIFKNVRTDLLANADLQYALVISEINEQRDIRVRQFSLLAALNNPASESDLILEEYDQVLVFSVPADASDRGPYSRQILLDPVLARLRSQAREESPVQVFSVAGAVRAPGVYPLVDGNSVSMMLSAAGGLRDSAYLDSAELRTISIDQDGRIMTRNRSVDLTRVISGDDIIRVASRDNLLVREFDDWSPSSSVLLTGEVVFPGTYLISRDEPLSSVIERAGGLTSDAFYDGAIFSRQKIARLEELRAKEFAQSIRKGFATMMLTEESTNRSYSEIKEVTDVLDSYSGEGRLLIDLLSVLRDPAVDINLEDGDALEIPKRSNTVSVVGEVNRSSTHAFEVGLTIEDYLELSAGMTARADGDGVYIVRANGQVTLIEKDWWRFDEERRRIRPGDTVVVPVNIEHKQSLARWREVTQIFYQSVVSLAAVARL